MIFFRDFDNILQYFHTIISLCGHNGIAAFHGGGMVNLELLLVTNQLPS